MKRKFIVGDTITSFEDLLRQELVMVVYAPGNIRTTHKQFVLSQTFRTVERQLRSGMYRKAVRLTNREFYGDMTTEAVWKKVGQKLCEYCEMNPYQHYSCDENSREKAALEWLEDEVE